MEVNGTGVRPSAVSTWSLQESASERNLLTATANVNVFEALDGSIYQCPFSMGCEAHRG